MVQGPADEETALKILEELDRLENLEAPEPAPEPTPQRPPQPAPKPEPKPEPQNVNVRDLNRPYEEKHDTDSYPLTLH